MRLYSLSKLVSYTTNLVLSHYCFYKVDTWCKSRDFRGQSDSVFSLNIPHANGYPHVTEVTRSAVCFVTDDIKHWITHAIVGRDFFNRVNC